MRKLKMFHLNTFEIFYDSIVKLYHKAGLHHANWLDTVRTSITIKRERCLCNNDLIYTLCCSGFILTLGFITNTYIKHSKLCGFQSICSIFFQSGQHCSTVSTYIHTHKEHFKKLITHLDLLLQPNYDWYIVYFTNSRM